MALVKFNPARSLPSVFSELFDWNSDVFRGLGFGNHINTQVPLVNTKENDTEYTLEVLAPKLEPADIKIEVEDQWLHITVEKEMEEKFADNLRQEYQFTYTNRSFKLPENINSEKITATSEKGLILIHIPKKEVTKSKRKQIDIE